VITVYVLPGTPDPRARFAKYLTIYRKIIERLGYSKIKLRTTIAKDFS